MKGIITRKFFTTMLLAGFLGLAGCSNQPTDGGNGTGTGTGGDGGGVMSQYAVQLIASSSEAKANEIQQIFQNEGYNSFVSTTQVGNNTLYRVRIGPFATEAEAQNKLAEMQTRYQQNPLVSNAIIKPHP